MRTNFTFFQKGVILLDQKITDHTWVAIIAGGQGTRLFPLSHDAYPKQFCHINDNDTFIQATIKRFLKVGIKSSRIVIITTNKNQTHLAKEQCIPLGVLSLNIHQIPSYYGYAGAMVKAAELIHKITSKAIIINTPADQYIAYDENFENTIKNAIESASSGTPTIIGVKISDLVTVMGCGHAIYDPEEPVTDNCYHVKGFVEKPKEKEAKKLMLSDTSACNTGINVWTAKSLLEAISSSEIDETGLNTDTLMQKLENLKLAVGEFRWYDCGTLKSLYDISTKTPNHKNANLGKGKVKRTDCRRSLFYSIEGIELRVTNIKDCAVLATVIDDRVIVAVVKLADSQRVKGLAEDYQLHKDFLTDDFSVSSRNNIIVPTNFSKEIRVGFVGVDNCIVYTHKNDDDTIEIAVSATI